MSDYIRERKKPELFRLLQICVVLSYHFNTSWNFLINILFQLPACQAVPKQANNHVVFHSLLITFTWKHLYWYKQRKWNNKTIFSFFISTHWVTGIFFLWSNNEYNFASLEFLHFIIKWDECSHLKIYELQYMFRLKQQAKQLSSQV